MSGELKRESFLIDLAKSNRSQKTKSVNGTGELVPGMKASVYEVWRTLTFQSEGDGAKQTSSEKRERSK